MKVTAILFGVCLGLFSSAGFAGLKCTDFRCDVAWKTKLGDIDLSTVCYNYQGKPQYQECRNLAVDVFRKRCQRGKANNNSIWVDVYCGALNKYHP